MVSALSPLTFRSEAVVASILIVIAAMSALANAVVLPGAAAALGLLIALLTGLLLITGCGPP